MWTEHRGLQRCWACSRRWPARFARPATGVCAAVLALTVQGCLWTSSTREAPVLPVLTSLQRLEHEGRPGVWMDSDDAGRLAVWIYEATGEEGK